ncbi:MAG: hypothetical protein JWP36_3 [Paucimonas sp.]|nr:hypothetical protein [Paucimonas sp.]
MVTGLHCGVREQCVEKLRCVDPIPTLTLPLKRRGIPELRLTMQDPESSLPFKGRAGVGMGLEHPRSINSARIQSAKKTARSCDPGGSLKPVA